MRYIKVECEYDFGGDFGGNNNEDVFIVPDDVTAEEVEAVVLSTLCVWTGCSEEELEDLYDWSWLTVTGLDFEQGE